MQKNINDMIKEFYQLNASIKNVLADTRYKDLGDLSGISLDYENADQLFLLDEAYTILSQLQDIAADIDYLRKPVVHQGTLHRNSSGRYEIDDLELTSGYIVEYLDHDDFHATFNEKGEYINVPYWRKGRIEHNGTDYYIVENNKLLLENLQVRIRM